MLIWDSLDRPDNTTKNRQAIIDTLPVAIGWLTWMILAIWLTNN